MASVFEKILSRNKKKKDEIINPYDDGTVWELPETTRVSPKLSDYMTTKNKINPAFYNMLKNIQYGTGIVKDPLEAPRNQMKYYTKQLNSLGIDPVEPETSSRKSFFNGIGGELLKMFQLTSIFENTLAGATDKAIKGQDELNRIDNLLEEKLTEAVKNNDFSNIKVSDISKLYEENYTGGTRNLGAGLKSGFATVKQLWDDEAQEDVVDWGTVINNSQETETMKWLGDIVEAPGYGVSKMFGASDETAEGVGNLVGDIGISILTGNITDIDGVGKAIKYLRNADKVDDIAKVASNISEAEELIRKANPIETVKKSLEINADKLGNKVDDKFVDEYYEKFIKSNAEKLMKDTNKYLGGINNFDGVKIGNKTVINKEALKALGSNNFTKVLTEAGLSAFSPIGAVLNGSVTSKVGELIGKTEIGSKVIDNVQGKLSFGKNNEWVKSAKKAYEDGRTDEVMKNVAQKSAGVIAENQRKVKEMFAVMKNKELKKRISTQSANELSEFAENHGKVIKEKEYVQETIINPDLVDSIANQINSHYAELSKGIMGNIDTKNISDLKDLKAISDEIKSLEEVIPNMGINYNKNLEKFGLSDFKDKYFMESLQMSLEDLTELISKEGNNNSYEIAKKLKTSANAVIDVIEEAIPTLKGKFSGRKLFDFTKQLNRVGNNYEVQDINLLKKKIKEIRTKNETYKEQHGEYSKYFNEQIEKLNIEIDKQKEYIKRNPTPKKEKPIKVKKEEEKVTKLYWEEKLDKYEPEGAKGSKEIINGREVKDTKEYKIPDKVVIKSDDANIKVNRISSSRDRLKEKIKNSDIKMSTSQEKDLDMLTEEQIKDVSLVIDRRIKMYKESKYFLDNNSRVANKMKQWFSNSGYEQPRDVEEMLTMMSELRAKGINVPNLNFKKIDIEKGKLNKLGNATISKNFEAPSKESINRARSIIKSSNGNKERIKSLFNFIDNTIKEAEFDYNGDLKTYYRAIKSYLKSEGIDVSSTMIDNLMKGKLSLNKFKSYVADSVDKQLNDTLNNLTKSELDLYISLYNHDKMPNLSSMLHGTNKSNEIFKYLEHEKKYGNENSYGYSKFDEVEEERQKLRDKWLVEPHESKDTKEYAGNTYVNTYKSEDDVIRYNEETERIQELHEDTLLKEYEENQRVLKEEMDKPDIKKEAIEEGVATRTDVPIKDVKIDKPKVETIDEIIQEEEATINNNINKDKGKPIKTETIKNKAEKVENLNKPKLPKEPNKTRQTKKIDGKIIGIEFEVNGRRVIIDENTPDKDLAKVFVDDLVSDVNVFTNKLKSSGLATRDKEVFVKLKGLTANDVKTTIAHENTHILQKLIKEDMIGGKELKDFMSSLPSADKQKVTRLIHALNKAGIMNTSEDFVRAKQLCSYITGFAKGKKNILVMQETDAIVGSLILHGDEAVRNFAQEVFGEGITEKYAKRLADYSVQDFGNYKKFVRTNVSEELSSKASVLRKAIEVSGKDNVELFKKVSNLVEVIKTNSDSSDNAEKLLSVLETYKDIAPGEFEKAVKDIDRHMTIWTEVEKLTKIDLSSTITKEEFDVYNEIQNYFKEFGIEEGIIKEGEEDLFANYVYHSLNPKFKMDKDAQKVAREKWGASISEVFNANAVERRYKGTIKDINDSFNKALKKAGLEPMSLFETNIIDIYTKRAFNNANVMYNKTRQDGVLETFGMEYVTNWQKAVDTEDNLAEVLRSASNELEDSNITEIVEAWKKSNKTIYQFLKDESGEYGLKGLYDDYISDYTAESFARKGIEQRFGSSGMKNIDETYVVYNSNTKKLERATFEQEEKAYKKKLEDINIMKSKGMSDASWKDNKLEAEQKGLEFVDNARVQQEAWDIVKEEALSKSFIDMDKDEIKDWYRARRQEVRRKLRNKYKADKDVLYAYNDVEINYQSAYKDMMESMIHSGDYVIIEKQGARKFSTLNTVGEMSDIQEHKAEDLSDYKIVDASSVRKRAVVEHDSKQIVMRKEYWDNYQKEIQRQLKRDEGVFLKAYDKVTNIFKAMALGSGRFITNSAFGNFFESYMTSGVNLLNPKAIKEFLKFKAGKELNIEGYSTLELKTILEQSGVFETEAINELAGSDTAKVLKNMTEEKSSPLKKMTGKANPFSDDFLPYKAIRATQNEIEQMSRFINVTTHLKRGESMAQAIDITQKALFDYSDLTDFEIDVMKRVIPFYTFMRNNIPLQLENLADRPTKYARMFGAYEKANEEFNSEKDMALRPSYLDNALSIGNNKFLSLPNPVMDLEKLFNPNEMAQSLNPIIKTPIELITNKELFSGNDISKQDKLSEKVKHVIDSTFPMFNQYGKALSDAKKGNYQRLANILGVPIKTFDVAKAEKQTMYEYVEQLENQYYEFLENNPEAKLYLEELKKRKNTTSNTKTSPLSRLIKN